MLWSTETMESLQIWLHGVISTNGGVREDDKFYSFIAKVWNEKKAVWDEALAREIINKKIRELGEDPNKQYISDEVNMYFSKGTMILEFLRQHATEIKP